MRKAFRIVSIAGALGAASLSLTACDASPYAASVNGHVVTVNSLNHQLAAWTSNKAWVQDFNAASSPAQGGDGTTVAGTGGAGTYNSKFVAEVLATVIETEAVHQRLTATGRLPGQDEVVASRAVNEYVRGQYWDQFPQEVRDFFVERLADWGALTQAPSDPSSLQGPYSEIQPYLFSSVCLIQASVPTQQEAAAMIFAKKANGAEVCFDQISLERQSPAYQSAVRGLVKIGDMSSALKTSFGYQVLQLTKRVAPGLSLGVQQVITAAETPPSEVTSIVSSARVRVNPRYGTWSNGQVSPPQLTNS